MYGCCLLTFGSKTPTIVPFSFCTCSSSGPTKRTWTGLGLGLQLVVLVAICYDHHHTRGAKHRCQKINVWGSWHICWYACHLLLLLAHTSDVERHPYGRQPPATSRLHLLPPQKTKREKTTCMCDWFSCICYVATGRISIEKYPSKLENNSLSHSVQTLQTMENI